jgi:hypothetical protein
MRDNDYFPIAVHHVPANDSLQGAGWDPLSDPWIVARLSPVAKYFPRSIALSCGSLSIRWFDDRWIVAWAITKPPRENVVVRATVISDAQLWRVAVPIARALVEGTVEFDSPRAILRIQPTPEDAAEPSLSLVLGMLASPPPSAPRRILAAPKGTRWDSLVRIATAFATFVSPHCHTVVCPTSADESIFDPKFLNLEWDTVVGIEMPVQLLQVESLSPYAGKVRGVRTLDLQTAARVNLDRLFDNWTGSDGRPWEDRVTVPIELVPAHRLTDQEWFDRLLMYQRRPASAANRDWDFECLTSTPSPFVLRCIDLFKVEAELGLERTIRNAMLSHFCGITTDEIKGISRQSSA